MAPAVGVSSSDVPVSGPLAPDLPAEEPQSTVSDQSMRYPGRRIAGQPRVFDTGAPALPFAPSRAPSLPDDAWRGVANDDLTQPWFLRG